MYFIQLQTTRGSTGWSTGWKGTGGSTWKLDGALGGSSGGTQGWEALERALGEHWVGELKEAL